MFALTAKQRCNLFEMERQSVSVDWELVFGRAPTLTSLYYSYHIISIDKYKWGMKLSPQDHVRAMGFKNRIQQEQHGVFRNETECAFTKSISHFLTYSLSLSLHAYMHVQLTKEFFCMSPRVPVFNVGAEFEFRTLMFIKFTRKTDDASVNMDFETIDKNELKQ